MKEIWKDIKEINTNHQISNLGRVKVVARTYINSLGVEKHVAEKIKIPDTKGIVSLEQHPFKIKTLLLRYFPNEYINAFVSENSLLNETWKDIKGYEGYYKVSSLGRVLSLPRITGIKKQSRNGKTILIPNCSLGKILKLNANGTKDKDGNYRLGVTLRKNGTMKTYLINRLVAQAFIPNPDNLPEVNHIDRDIHNNSIENLEWVTKEFNIQHALLSREAIVALYKLAKKENLTPSELVLKLVNNYSY